MSTAKYQHSSTSVCYHLLQDVSKHTTCAGCKEKMDVRCSFQVELCLRKMSSNIPSSVGTVQLDIGHSLFQLVIIFFTYTPYIYIFQTDFLFLKCHSICLKRQSKHIYIYIIFYT